MQNADDAGAKEVKFFVLGAREVSASGQDYLHKGFRDYSGPALYAWNDAAFAESDFKAIRNIGASSKTKDATKTGKFGLGFNAVYHFTDMPSFLTGRYLVIMDPHQRMLLGDDGEKAFARRWDCLATDIGRYSGHVKWFEVVGHPTDLSSEYGGTMFRFPLRTPSHAEMSDLSRETWTIESIGRIFQQFQVECEPMLLFLKSAAW